MTQANIAPASPAQWKQALGLSVKTRPHSTQGTKAEQVNTNTETARWVKQSYLPASLIILIHPLSRTRFHIINTMTVTLILTGLLQGLQVTVSILHHYKRKPGSLWCTRGGWTYNDTCAIAGLTVSSWVSRVVRSGLVIIEHYQKHQESMW